MRFTTAPIVLFATPNRAAKARIESARMPELLRGVDVSHYQNPHAVPYARLAASGYSFVIANATDGTKRDPTFLEHIGRAREAGLICGAYLYWMQRQDPVEQAHAFREAVEAAGLGVGSILPALDLEWRESEKPDPVRFASARTTAALLRDWFGGCMVYTAQHYWTELGKPAWWLEHPLWLASYVSDERRIQTLDGAPWAIWQWAAAPIPGLYDKPIDQNRARALPLVEPAPPSPEDWELEEDTAVTRADLTRSAEELRRAVEQLQITPERDIEAERADRDALIRERDK